MSRLVFAVDAATTDLTTDDRQLASALLRRGVTVDAAVWGTIAEPAATVVIRSTWDYVDRPAEFVAWLDELDAHGSTVVNPTSMLRWNMHKEYLLDLERYGVPIVPTELVRRGDERTLEAIRVGRGWDQVVVKPAVGGTARETVHSGRIDDAGAHLARLAESEDALVQPVIDSLLAEGEVSVIAVGGRPLGAVLKTAAPGEWRVQSDFGGGAAAIPLSDDLAAFARTSLEAVTGRFGSAPAYARVDLARVDGEWALMELELVEPELFFRLDAVFADGLAELLAALAG